MVQIISSGSSLGTSIEAGEITDGAVSYIKLGSDIKKVKFLETLTFSGDASQTSGTLDAHDFYIIEYSLVNASGSTNIYLTFNSLANAKYNYSTITATSVTNATNQASFILASVNANVLSTGEVYFKGASAGAENRIVGGAILGGIYTSGTLGLTFDNNVGASTQISTFTVGASAGTLTGTVKIYGGDY